MPEVNQADEPKTIQVSFGEMMQSKAAQKGILNDIAQRKPPELGKAVPKEK